MTEYSQKVSTRLTVPVVISWSVHLLTASGAVWGLLSILAIERLAWREAFLWMAVAIIVDSFDGTLARIVHTRRHTPGFDAEMLDNMIDYLNYVVIPAYFLIKSGLVPAGWELPTAVIILLTSAYQFCQPAAKTEDHYFKGFPSYWNVAVMYLFLLAVPLWLNLVILLGLAILVFIPIKYIYPSRTERNRRLSKGLSYLYGVIGVIALVQYPETSPWLLWVSLIYVVYYVVMSAAHMLKARQEARAA